jgi:hypothetical protein
MFREGISQRWDRRTRSQRVLGGDTETEAIDHALDMVIVEFVSSSRRLQLERRYFAQFSTESPAIRLNSRSLFVARVTSIAIA